MSVQLLTRREPLLKTNQFVGFVGKLWREPYQGPGGGAEPTFWRITSSEPRRRRFDGGIILRTSANLPITVNVGNTATAGTIGPLGLLPETDGILYETRWGLGPHQFLYVLVPQGQIRGRLEAPGFTPQPAAATDRRLIGIWTYQDSPLQDPRLVVMMHRSMSIEMQVQQNTPMNYWLSMFWIIVNTLKIEQIQDAALIQQLLDFSKGPGRGVPWRPIFSPDALPL